jgi:multiple sugar transport system substrate-binding protein
MARTVRPCRLLVSLLSVGALLLAGCIQQERSAAAPNAPVTIVFKHSKLFGDPQAFTALIRRFEERHPAIRVRAEVLPATSDEQYQFYVINLRAGSTDFDVFALDVIWVAGFARAGWLAEVSELLPPAAHHEFFPGPMNAVRYRDGVYAVPWFIDAGLLYYRKDLLEKHRIAPPQTWDELVRAAQTISAREPNVYGFIWQGRQYEGLVCNALEYMWSAGGDVLRDGRVVLDSPANRRALAFMRALVHETGVSPELVTTTTEEPARRIFGDGRAVFLRNWPYAWSLFEQPGSPVRGKVGVMVLPHFPGHESAATLGGWQLGINRHSRRAEAAAQFVRFMTSAEAQKALALANGLNPSRRALYSDAELIRAQPHLAPLRAIFERARPRPVTPYYVRVSQVLQSELSAVVAGIKTPPAALATAQQQVEAALRP